MLAPYHFCEKWGCLSAGQTQNQNQSQSQPHLLFKFSSHFGSTKFKKSQVKVKILRFKLVVFVSNFNSKIECTLNLFFQNNLKVKNHSHSIFTNLKLIFESKTNSNQFKFQKKLLKIE